MAARMYNVSRALMIFEEHALLLRRHNQILVNSKRHVRVLRRRPVAILYPNGERETFIKSNEAANKSHETLAKQQKGKALSGRYSFSPEESGYKRRCSGGDDGSEEFPPVKDELCGLRFEKAAAGDERLAKMSSMARSRAFRDKEGKVLLEGKRLILDALSAGAAPQMLFFSSMERLLELPLEKLKQTKLIKVKFEDLKIWSDLVTPQGVIAIFKKPDASHLSFPKEAHLQSVPLFLLCDNIHDSGNLGTILRCAAAAGCERVLLSKGCVDVWEPKVLRAAMGAHFRLPVFPNLDWGDVSKHLPTEVIVHVVDNCRIATKEHLREIESVTSDESSESDSDVESDDEPSLARLKPQVYHESWAQRSTALVIGGEALGPSLEALRLAEETGGKRLFVPMAPGVDSLNSAMAASVLLFEGRRQLLDVSDKSRRQGRSKMFR